MYDIEKLQKPVSVTSPSTLSAFIDKAHIMYVAALIIGVPAGFLFLGIVTGSSAILNFASDSFFFISFLVGSTLIIKFISKNNRFEKQLHTYAKVNNLTYLRNSSATPHGLLQTDQGLLFNIGINSKYRYLIGNKKFVVGEYVYTSNKSGKSRQYTWSFASLCLSKKLPHVVLDSKRNSGLPISYDSNQLMTSESELNRFFNVYTPEGQITNVLSFIAPDLMEVIVNDFTEYDIEIVDKQIFLYFNWQLSAESAHAMLQKLNNAVNEIEDNTIAYNASLSPIEKSVQQANGRKLSVYTKPLFVSLFGIGAMIALFMFTNQIDGDTPIAIGLWFVAVMVVRVVTTVAERR